MPSGVGQRSRAGISDAMAAKCVSQRKRFISSLCSLRPSMVSLIKLSVLSKLRRLVLGLVVVVPKLAARA